MNASSGLIGEVLPEEIRAATDRMILSDVFARSPQLGAFLRFVVEAVLHGKADRIKAYTIGVEVLRRDTTFDPQLDPIVRVEATRLRRAIERYYTGPGVADSIIIDLPRGSYVPTFRRREIVSPRIAPLQMILARWPNHRVPALISLGILGVVVVVGIAAAVFYSRHDHGTATAGIHGSEIKRVTALAPGNGMPTIQIEPFHVIGAPDARGVSAQRLHATISDAFARFDTVNVASGEEPRAEYRLNGTIEYAGETANAWFTLTSSSEGKIVWSRTFERVQSDAGPGVTGDSIVIALTNSLLQSYGVIRARDRANQLASNVGDPRYRCILIAADSMRTADRKTHDQARACLEQLTAIDPSFAVGFTFLSLMYNREFQLEYPPHDGDPPALDRALRAARQAIALHPESSRGYLALMVIQFNRRDIAAALAAGEKCMRLNKYDMLALGEYGGRLIMAGDVTHGMEKLREAGAHGAVRPAWHHIYLFIGSYIAGDMAAAAKHASDIPNDNVALGEVARALAAKAMGDGEGTRRAIDRLETLGAGWRRDPHAELARLIADEGIVDRLSRDLAAAGLPGAS